MEDFFLFPHSANVKVEIHFQGRKINKNFYKRNSSLFSDYPVVGDVAATRKEVLKNRQPDMHYTIIVSEDGIYTVET